MCQQSRSFPKHRCLTLAFFANTVSITLPYISQRYVIYGFWRNIPECSLKAGYTAHNVRHMQVHAQPAKATYALRPIGSPRQLGSKLYAITTLPKVLTLSPCPSLGNQSKHQELHRYALWRYWIDFQLNLGD